MDQHLDTGQHTNPWLEAARSVPTTQQSTTPPINPSSTTTTPIDSSAEPSRAWTPEPATAPSTAFAGKNLPVRYGLHPVLVSVHGGAGATVWSRILEAVDGGTLEAWCTSNRNGELTGPVVLVLRASVDGIAAARHALSTQGTEAFTFALVVPAGPGKAPRQIMAELRILGGAIPTVHVPWVPGLLLKRSDHIAPSDIPAKELTKLTTALTRQGVPIEGETP
ncbi:hypothetical protein [Paeniglutamicibacter cryotolerans]|uniref:Uncharacterized protein n=1 Tax=Paeniglutamicibacter cryotolerans TaxID=670079 RepID=A0A839QW70_9MICC|nr:hypothetical protein [Paeniglutamicibacter cryotolerans]MBB2997552.1 hypothetical protein [Paeniglutamicibacter cryotolerans]